MKLNKKPSVIAFLAVLHVPLLLSQLGFIDIGMFGMFYWILPLAITILAISVAVNGINYTIDLFFGSMESGPGQRDDSTEPRHLRLAHTVNPPKRSEFNDWAISIRKEVLAKPQRKTASKKKQKV